MSQAPERCQRGTFHDQYAIPRDRRDKRSRWPRLLECMTYVMKEDEPNFCAPGSGSEFAVCDTKTREQAWFEVPAGATTYDLEGLIEDHFAVRPIRLRPMLWVV